MTATMVNTLSLRNVLLAGDQLPIAVSALCILFLLRR